MKSYARSIRRLVFLALATATAAGAARASEAAARFPVTPEQIAAALADHGFALQPDQIVLPMRITATAAAPMLDADAPERAGRLGTAGSEQARVRIRCRDHAACLPFYVRIPWPAPARELAENQAGVGIKAGAEIHVGAQAVVRAGARATLVIDDHRIHIRVPVICLETGEPGRTIRASSLDHKQVYQAEVMDATLLKGSL
jgi:hypothetical protein